MALLAPAVEETELSYEPVLFVFLKILLRMMGTKSLQPVMASLACVDMCTSCNKIYMA